MAKKNITQDVYTNLLSKVKLIIKKKGFNIKEKYLKSQDDNTVIKYDFNILHGDKIVTELTCYYSEDQVIKGVTRNAYANYIDEMVFNITWVNTIENYEGQGLGTLIFIYSICYLKNKHKNTEYVILDDDSKNSSKIKNNIYNNLGFSFKGFQSLREEISQNDNLEDEPLEIVMSGPEKQLKLGINFIKRAEKILNNIVLREKNNNTSKVSRSTRVSTTISTRYEPYKKKGGKKDENKYTIKELKDISIKNKIKITKIQNEKKIYLTKKDLIKKLKRYKLI